MTNGLAYYVEVQCPKCDGEIYYGPCLTLLEYKGLPVVSGTEIEQERVDCPECDTSVYFGELDYFTEGGGTEDDED